MSIPTAFNTTNEQSGVIESFEYDTTRENIHVLYYIARNQLYSDELMAILREYWVNARDVHVATNQANRPVRVSLPTQLDPFLKIRDFGTGLDSEGVKEYASFGASSKRGDPLQTGQLGIGCKCGFTYGDSFLVSSYVNGRMNVWNSYIDTSNRGRIDKLGEVDTTEENGIEVCIPIRNEDIDKCHEKAIFFFSFVNVKPDIFNFTQEEQETFKARCERAPMYFGNGWRYFGKNTLSESYALMGDIPYPMKSVHFTELEMDTDIKEILDGGLVINFDMDSLDFAASREQLKYTPKTKRAITARMVDVTNDLIQQCSNTFTHCANLWEAEMLHQSVFDFWGTLHRLRGLLKSKLVFKGKIVKGQGFSVGTDKGVTCFVYKDGGAGIVRNQVVNIKPAKDSHVVINDGICNCIPNRLVGKIKGVPFYKFIYVLNFASDEHKKTWLESTGFDYPCDNLSQLPKETFSKYYPSVARSYGDRTKMMKQEFVLDGKDACRYKDPRSAYWNIVEVDPSNDEGVYVALNRFEADGLHPSYFKSLCEQLAAAGVEVPEIYGFKKDSILAAQNNPKMKPFRDWMKDVVTQLIQDPNTAQEIANRNYLYRNWGDFRYMFSAMLREMPNWSSLTDESHEIRVFLKKIEQLQSFDCTKVDRVLSLLSSAGLDDSIIKTLPIYHIDAHVKTIRNKYPLLYKSLLSVGCEILDKNEWVESLNEYVSVMDLVKS
jgi:hypothetical protein